MRASLAKIRIAYIATFNQRMAGDLTFQLAGQMVFDKLGSDATKRLISRIRMMFQHQPELSVEEMVALAKDWEVMKSFDGYMIITGTGAVVAHDETLKGALDEALEFARDVAAKKQVN